MYKFRRQNLSEEAIAALRQELQSLPVPEASPGFDARVRAALREPERPRLEVVWVSLRPAVAAAAFSLLATLALLQGLTTISSARPDTPRMTVGYGTLASAGISPSLRGELLSGATDIRN